MSVPTDALDAALRIAGELEKNHIDYAIGGALAYAQYGIPRATFDVDINVFLDTENLVTLSQPLQALGIVLPQDIGKPANDEGLIVGHWQETRIDLFIPSIPFCDEAAKTKRRLAARGQEAWFLSAEALSVFKLLFFRGKDIADLERLVAVMGHKLDCAYVRKHIVEMMSEDDPRTTTWDQLVRDFNPR